MSKTFKTDPTDVQIRRQMKADPYRSTEKNGVHSRMLYRNKYSAQYDVIFRANEVSQMEAFLSMLDNNKDTTKIQHSTRSRSLITYTVKGMNGYLQTGSAYTYGSYGSVYGRKIRVRTKFDHMKGYSQSDFDDIVARVAVHKNNNSKTRGATYDVFNVITVNEEVTLNNPKDDEKYEYAMGHEFDKMFPRYRDAWESNEMAAKRRSLRSYREDDLDMGDHQSDPAMAKYEDNLTMLDYNYQIPLLLDDYDFDEALCPQTADGHSTLVYTTESQ